MTPLKPGETIIEKKIGVKSGTLGYNSKGIESAFDTYLVEDSSKNLILIVFMKMHFIFHPSYEPSDDLTYLKPIPTFIKPGLCIRNIYYDPKSLQNKALR